MSFSAGSNNPTILPKKSSLIWEHILNNPDLNQTFYCRRVENTAAGLEIAGNLNNYWKITGSNNLSGTLTCPFSGNTPSKAVCLYFINAMLYPSISVLTKLPDWTGVNEGQLRHFYMGFENGGTNGNAIVTFDFERTAANADALICQVQGGFGTSTGVSFDLTAKLPANYTTTTHVYSIFTGKDCVYFHIDNSPVLCVVFAPGGGTFNTGSPTMTATTQMQISVVNIPLPKSMNPFLEVMSTTALTADLVVNLPPWAVRYYEGDASGDLPFCRDLYRLGLNAKIRGNVITNGSNFDTERFTCLGYSSRVLRFAGDQDVTLTVNAANQDGTFRAMQTLYYTANQVIEYNIATEHQVVSINISNASGASTTPTVCEVDLR